MLDIDQSPQKTRQARPNAAIPMNPAWFGNASSTTWMAI